MKSGPGKRAKTTTNKATVKGAVNMVKNLFSTGSKNLGKAKGPGGLAGVASNKGGVRTLTSAKVTGSKKAGIESLKAKKKSGEMSRQEANAKIKNLRGVSVKPKPLVLRTITAGKGGRSIAQMEKMNAMDSTTYMNALPASARSSMLNQMKGYQKKDSSVRFSNFKYDPKTATTLYTRTYKKGKKQ
jgi:hypothetical protein